MAMSTFCAKGVGVLAQALMEAEVTEFTELGRQASAPPRRHDAWSLGAGTFVLGG